MQGSFHTSCGFLQEFDAVFGAQEGAALSEKSSLSAAAAQQLHRTAPTQVARDAWGQNHPSQLPHRALHVSCSTAAATTDMGVADEPACAAQTQLQQAQDQLRLALQQLNRALEATGAAEAAGFEGEQCTQLSGGLEVKPSTELESELGSGLGAELCIIERGIILSIKLDREAWRWAWC